MTDNTFDLEKAKVGQCRASGSPARIVCFDARGSEFFEHAPKGKTMYVGKSTIIEITRSIENAGSSNGRTADFESVNAGSNPDPATSAPQGQPKEE